MAKSNSGLSEFNERLEQNINDALDVVGNFIKEEEKNAASGVYGDELRAYKDGAYSGGFVYDRPNKTTVRNGNAVEYSAYLEFGTGEFAKNGDGRKGGWRFKDAQGNWWFTRGMKPKGIMQTTINSNDDEILDIITKAINAK
jgi:hypothetical protein